MSEIEKDINYNDPEIKTLHTYTSDMADAIRTDENSVIKIALAEKSKRDKEEVYKKDEGTPMTKTLLMFFGVLIILGSLVGLYFIWQKNKIKNAPPIVIQKESSLVSFEEEVKIDTTNIDSNSDLALAIRKEVDNQETSGSVKQIKLENKNGTGTIAKLPIEELFTKMHTTAPGRFTRSVESNYMIGVYQKHLFFLFESNDYSQSFTGLLEWEKGFLYDMASFFNIDMTSSNKILLTQPLHDSIIENLDVRAVRNQINKDILYYLILDKNKVLITDSPDSIREIANRLLIKK